MTAALFACTNVDLFPVAAAIVLAALIIGYAFGRD